MAVILIGRLLSSTTDSVRADQGNPGAGAWPVKDVAKLVTEQFDYFSVVYNSANQIQTVVYKLGGVSGATVATVTLGYVGNLLASVTRT